MKDFISKVTFGFLMAQLLPGVLVVFALSCVRSVNITPTSLDKMLENVGISWFSSPFKVIVFLFFSIGVGMFIHGINWLTLAWIENRENIENPKAIREIDWHEKPVWLQLLGGPLRMIYEMLLFLRVPNLDSLTMDENVPAIHSEDMPKFTFLQEFYLNFGQFYAHTAYALLFSFFCSIICMFRSFCYPKLVFILLMYFLSSFFFLLGRATLSTLFKAEVNMREETINGGRSS